MNILFIIKDKIKRLFMKDDKKIYDILDTMNDRIAHIEDAIIDHRNALIKIAKQGNQIVNFLNDVEDLEDMYKMDNVFELSENKENKSFYPEKEVKKYKNLIKLIDEFTEKNKELKEFEEELEKHKDKLTPGQVGES